MTHNPPLILVADDEHTAAMMLKHIFNREGYQVEIASDGLSALAIAKERLPNLILLDIQMPRMNGFEVLRQLRETPQTAAIPTIVVSARARTPADIALGLNIGADDYIAKPFAPKELLARARSKMRARQLEESLQQRKKELEILLRTSEELNRNLDFDQLLSLLLYLTLDLLPCDLVFIGRCDNDGNLTDYRAHLDGSPLEEENSLTNHIKDYLCALDGEHFWADAHQAILGYQYGIALPLIHGVDRVGVLLIGNQDRPLEDNHHILLRGIARQAGLAVHNAKLYAAQQNYAQHLEETVRKRTTELTEAQQLLFRSEKLASIGRLAASIAHEINNPLQPIQLNLEYLLEDIQAGNTIDVELISMTQHSVQRIRRIVQQLLAFTHTNNQPQTGQIKIQDVLRTIIKLNQHTLKKSRVELVTDIEDVPAIDANPDQLEQVFMNIILNAVAAMPEGGTIAIRVWAANGSVYITLSDTGAGIAPEIINDIFDPFVSTKPNGSGLGLFVTYSIIEKHQGTIDVQSEVGVGTTFTLSLPLPQ
jgi:two-component system, NtrC family, sensor kinase